MTVTHKESIELVDAIAAQDTITSTAKFNELMSAKIADALDQRRQEVASSMFESRTMAAVNALATAQLKDAIDRHTKLQSKAKENEDHVAVGVHQKYIDRLNKKLTAHA